MRRTATGPDGRRPIAGAHRGPGEYRRSQVVKDHAGSGDPAVVLEEPAEAFPALDRPGRERDHVRLLAAGHRRRDVAQALVTAFSVKMGEILGEGVSEVVLAEDDEVVQALGFQARPRLPPE
jgi:hypothetical protein